MPDHEKPDLTREITAKQTAKPIRRPSRTALDFLQNGFAAAGEKKTLWLVGYFAMFPMWIGVNSFMRDLAQNSLFFPMLFGAIGFALLLIRMVCAGGLISLVAKDRDDWLVRGAFDALSMGARSFPKIFAQHALAGVAIILLSSLFGLITYGFRSLAEAGCLLMAITIGLGVLFAFASSLILLTLGFAERFVILEGTGIAAGFSAGVRFILQHRRACAGMWLAQVILSGIGLIIVAIMVRLFNLVMGPASFVLIIPAYVALNGYIGVTLSAMYTLGFKALKP